MIDLRALPRPLAVLAAAFLLAPHPAAGQGGGAGDGVRVGLTLGGSGLVGLAVEYFDGSRSAEITLGTFAFRDLGVAVVGKQYFGASALRPVVGLGLWVVGAPAPEGGDRTGIAGILHAPVGVDWRAGGDHYVGATLAVNRALWIRRTDAEDDLPPSDRLVPLPGLYYRWSP